RTFVKWAVTVRGRWGSLCTRCVVKIETEIMKEESHARTSSVFYFGGGGACRRAPRWSGGASAADGISRGESGGAADAAARPRGHGEECGCGAAGHAVASAFA